MSDDGRPIPDAVPPADVCRNPLCQDCRESEASIPDAVRPSEAILARAMTVNASKLYALINLRHLQDELAGEDG